MRLIKPGGGEKLNLSFWKVKTGHLWVAWSPHTTWRGFCPYGNEKNPLIYLSKIGGRMKNYFWGTEVLILLMAIGGPKKVWRRERRKMGTFGRLDLVKEQKVIQKSFFSPKTGPNLDNKLSAFWFRPKWTNWFLTTTAFFSGKIIWPGIKTPYKCPMATVTFNNSKIGTRRGY